MKKIMALSIGLLVACLNSNIVCKNVNNIRNVLAQPGEDLSEYRDILSYCYVGIAEENCKEYVRKSVGLAFPIFERWVGQKGKVFIKILDGTRPVGFTVLESLNEEETRIAIHSTPLLPGYEAWYLSGFEILKQYFPNAKTISTTCSSHIKKMQERILALGFTVNPSYTLNEELVAAFESIGYEDFTGYTKILN